VQDVTACGQERPYHLGCRLPDAARVAHNFHGMICLHRGADWGAGVRSRGGPRWTTSPSSWRKSCGGRWPGVAPAFRGR